MLTAVEKHLGFLENFILIILNPKMKSVKRSLNEANKHEARRQRLLNKARRAHKKSSRLQKKIQRAVTKQNPDMSKINKWQNKSSKYVDKGLRYLAEIDALDKDENHESLDVNFKLEKVCWSANFQTVIELLSFY